MSASRSSAWTAWRTGMRQVTRAPAILALVWLVTILFSLPLTLGVHGDLERQLDASLEADRQSSGVSYDWLAEFGDGATGVSATLGAHVIGFAAVMDNLSAFLDRDVRPIVVTAFGVGYALLWTLLAGGIIDRFARQRPMRAHGVLQAVGGFAGRLLRLSVLSALAYGALFGSFHTWLGDLYDRFTDDLDSERTAFLIQLAVYGALVLALALVNLLFDYARVRLIVEDRRSVVGALMAAVRFVWRNAAGAVGLYLLDAALFVGVLAVYAGLTQVTPGATGTWIALVIGQLYVAARVWVKLVFWASATALFQGRLAHAGYAAARMPAWPDSAAAEALESGYTLLSVRPPSEAR